ncbi:hypothetical protein LCGC14_1305020, partial [marine sediment metagenome]
MGGTNKKGSKGFQPKEVRDRRKKAQKEHGYTFKSEYDQVAEMNEVLIRHKLRKSNESVDDFGLTKDFYKFIGISQSGRDYRVPMKEAIKEKLREDFANYYT